MRSALWTLLAGLVFAGCAPALVAPRQMERRTDPGPLLESLAVYNSGPNNARLAGKIKTAGIGSADFGGAVVGGEGLRLDAVAGPFGTPVFSLGCSKAKGCRAYVPSKGTVYVDPEGSWREILEKVLVGRVPVIGEAEEAWISGDGSPVLLFRGPNRWEERLEFSRANFLPERIFLSRPDEQPLLRISYGEYGPPVAGHHFPRRIEIAVREPRETYVVDVRRVEPAVNIDPSTFGLSPPPGTREEIVEGKAAWNETGTSVWPMNPKRPMER